jgi:two-component sensor histidine kinase
LFEHGIVSTLNVIIRGDGQPYGVLEIDSPVRHDYDDHDIVFLTGFANVLAEAVDTSKRNTAMLSALDRMKDMVVERDRMLAAKNVLLDEKSVLAQELQHRVRNNLQLVYGMLNKQIQNTMDGAGLEGFSAITLRVMTLANVYDHLLGTGLSRTIDFGGYISSLCSSFESLQQSERPNVVLTCHWEAVVLDLDTVTPLGLILSELISNSYAHAFPDGTGEINVSLTRNDLADVATLTFSDNGVGFSEAAGSQRRGLGLVKRLMEQVSGLSVAHSDRGTEWTLSFPIPAPTPAVACTAG